MTMMVTIMMRTTTLVGGSWVELSPDKDHGNDEEEDNDDDHDLTMAMKRKTMMMKTMKMTTVVVWFLGRTVTRLGSPA